jgi:hypothetical protein
MPHVERERRAMAGRAYARTHFAPDLLAEALVARLGTMIVARQQRRAAA